MVEDLTQVGYVARLAFPVHGPRQYLTSGYQGTLGHAFPSALGAKVAEPERAVVASPAMAAHVRRPGARDRGRSTASPSSRSCSMTAPMATSSG